MKLTPLADRVVLKMVEVDAKESQDDIEADYLIDEKGNTATTAPTLYEYDNFGNVTKQTLALSDSPTPLNSPVTEMAYSVESTDEGVFSITTNTRYNAEGNPLVSVQKSLISTFSDTLERKSLTIVKVAKLNATLESSQISYR